MAMWYTFLALVTTTALGASLAPSYREGCGRVWLTVHSPELTLNGSKLVDAVELNWDFTKCFDTPEKIGLFNGQPDSWSEALVAYSIPLDSHEGHIVTEYPFGDEVLPGGWQHGVGSHGPSCYWPWIAAGDDEKIGLINCLKIQPTWMEDHTEKLKSMRVGELVIPGTHNSGSWKFDSELNQAARDRWVLCQDRSVWAQLVHGIRYFDFRISYYEFYDNEEDRYWLNHNMIRVRPLVPLLREIYDFLNSTKEVVFIDAHHFPIGFYDAAGAPIEHVHMGLIVIVMRELGDFAAPYKWFSSHPKGPTMDQLIASDRRALFSYAENSITEANDFLWPNPPHLWANTNNVEYLLSFLDHAVSVSPAWNARSPLHSAMAQTTPTAMDILLMRSSLRINADAVNRNVTHRLRTTWRQKANIVSSDFFLANDVIDLSIEISVERATL